MDTSKEYISKVLHAAPFADNDAGIPQMCDLIRALAADRDTLTENYEHTHKLAAIRFDEVLYLDSETSRLKDEMSGRVG